MGLHIILAVIQNVKKYIKGDKNHMKKLMSWGVTEAIDKFFRID
jgi:hypothetical protein